MWVYFLHVCMSIKMHCLLNTGLLPTCRNMHTHTHTRTNTHTHAQTHTRTNTHAHTDTTLLHKLWYLTCTCISLKWREQHLGSHLTGGYAGPCSRHTPALTTRPAHGLPHTGSGSSHAFVLFPAALWDWACSTQRARRRGKWKSHEASEHAAAQRCSRHLAVTLQMHLINYDLLKNGARASAERYSK